MSNLKKKLLRLKAKRNLRSAEEGLAEALAA